MISLKDRVLIVYDYGDCTFTVITNIKDTTPIDNIFGTCCSLHDVDSDYEDGFIHELFYRRKGLYVDFYRTPWLKEKIFPSTESVLFVLVNMINTIGIDCAISEIRDDYSWKGYLSDKIKEYWEFE